jgi:lipoyl(octanoyl) transferase
MRVRNQHGGRGEGIGPVAGDAAVEWVRSAGLVPYAEACAFMARRVDAIAAGQAGELVWLLEHPPVYTAGTSARPEDLIDPGRFPVHRTGRGGQFTYHGPGQRVVYLMLDVRARWGDVRAFVAALEQLVIDTLAPLGIRGETRSGLVGVWVRRGEQADARYDKVAALGVRLRRWVSSHGIAINVAPDLEHFAGIVPCGIRADGVTSLERLGLPARMAEVDRELKAAFERAIGRTCAAATDPTGGLQAGANPAATAAG